MKQHRPFLSRLPRIVAAGGLLGSGSDPWGTGLLPGVGNLRNYELLIEAGFTPEQVVQIMTLNGARILGEDTQVGSIAPGKLADLMVVRGDPLRTPGDIYDVVTVFRDGIGYDSMRLREAATDLLRAFRFRPAPILEEVLGASLVHDVEQRSRGNQHDHQDEQQATDTRSTISRWHRRHPPKPISRAPLTHDTRTTARSS